MHTYGQTTVVAESENGRTMSRKMIRVHRKCGARIAGSGLRNYCDQCRKWLVGDAVVLVKKAPKGGR